MLEIDLEEHKGDVDCDTEISSIDKLFELEFGESDNDDNCDTTSIHKILEIEYEEHKGDDCNRKISSVHAIPEIDFEERNSEVDCDTRDIVLELYDQIIDARIILPEDWKCNHVSKKPAWKRVCFDKRKLFPCKYAYSKRLCEAIQRPCKTCKPECTCANYDPETSPFTDFGKKFGGEDDYSDDESGMTIDELIIEGKDVAGLESAPPVGGEDGVLGKKDLEGLGAGIGGDGKTGDDDGAGGKGGDDGTGEKKGDDGGEGGKKRGTDEGKGSGRGGICNTPCTLDGKGKKKPKIPCSEVLAKPCKGKCSKKPDSLCRAPTKECGTPVKATYKSVCGCERKGLTKKPGQPAKAKTTKTISCGTPKSRTNIVKNSGLGKCKGCKQIF